MLNKTEIKTMLKKIKWVFLSSALLWFTPALANEPNATDNTVAEMAAKGNALAEAKLGAQYLLGQNGTEKDEKKAAEWLLKAASQGILEAQVIIAAMYDRGLGMEMDVHKATAWYEKAAAQGHKPSLAILGRNDIAKGGIAFDYKRIRLGAAKQIPTEYAKQILRKK
jgi:TPR repeat protein